MLREQVTGKLPNITTKIHHLDSILFQTHKHIDAVTGVIDQRVDIPSNADATKPVFNMCSKGVTKGSKPAIDQENLGLGVGSTISANELSLTSEGGWVYHTFDFSIVVDGHTVTKTFDHGTAKGEVLGASTEHIGWFHRITNLFEGFVQSVTGFIGQFGY